MELASGGVDEDTEIELENEKKMLLEQEDWRGFFLPKTLDNSILFTRTQLL